MEADGMGPSAIAKALMAARPFTEHWAANCSGNLQHKLRRKQCER
jgi:hypothetical protein